MARTEVRVSAIIIKGNKILLIHRKKKEGEYWVFPGGGIEDLETDEEALKREVKEETNLDVLKHKLVFKTKFDKSSSIEHPFYLCEVSSGRAKIIGEEKEINSEENFYHLEWIKISELNSINLLPEEAKEFVIKSSLESDDKNS